MRNKLKNTLKIALPLILILYALPIEAQRYFEPQEPMGPPEFKLSIGNVAQTTERILEFDIYLLDSMDDLDFELASFQAGILLNSTIYSGGTISASLISGSSTLNSAETPITIDFVNTLRTNPGQSLIRLAGRSAPGKGKGTILSETDPGNCVIHIRLTSSVPFTSNSTAELAFTSSSVLNPLYATRVARYISGVNVQLKVTPGENALVHENPLLNPTVTNQGFLSSTSVNESIKVYSYEKAILIENKVGLTGHVAIFDITGREITSQNVTNQSFTRIPVQAESGSYIVKISSVNSPVVRKVFLQ